MRLLQAWHEFFVPLFVRMSPAAPLIRYIVPRLAEVPSDGSVSGGWTSSPAVPTSTSGAIAIPSTLGGYPVTIIGDSTFSGCRGPTGVTILNSAKDIVCHLKRYSLLPQKI